MSFPSLRTPPVCSPSLPHAGRRSSSGRPGGWGGASNARCSSSTGWSALSTPGPRGLPSSSVKLLWERSCDLSMSLSHGRSSGQRGRLVRACLRRRRCVRNPGPPAPPGRSSALAVPPGVLPEPLPSPSGSQGRPPHAVNAVSRAGLRLRDRTRNNIHRGPRWPLCNPEMAAQTVPFFRCGN